MSKKKTPLWLRALKDKDAAKFLKKHAEEFPTKSFLPDPIEFGNRRKHANEQIATLIAAHMPLKNKQMQKLAELFLTMPPREIAEELGWDRNKVYLRIRALKRFVVEKERREKEGLIDGRTNAVVPGKDLNDYSRKVKFTLHEQEKYAYLTTKLGWVDEEGAQFPPLVQDVLNELEEHTEGFEFLDVE